VLAVIQWHDITDVMSMVLTFVGFPGFMRMSTINKAFSMATKSIVLLEDATLSLGREIAPLATLHRLDAIHHDPEHTSPLFRAATSPIKWIWKKVKEVEIPSPKEYERCRVPTVEGEDFDRNVADTCFFFLSQIQHITKLDVRSPWFLHVDPTTSCKFQAQGSLQALCMSCHSARCGSTYDWLLYLTQSGRVPLSALQILVVVHTLDENDIVPGSQTRPPYFYSDVLGGSPVEKMVLVFCDLQLWRHSFDPIAALPHFANLRHLILHFCVVSLRWLTVVPQLDTLVLFKCELAGSLRDDQGLCVRARKAKLTMDAWSLRRLVGHLRTDHVFVWPTTRQFGEDTWRALLRAQPSRVEFVCDECNDGAAGLKLGDIFGAVPERGVGDPLSHLQLTVFQSNPTNIPWVEALNLIHDMVPPTVAHTLEVWFAGGDKRFLKHLRKSCDHQWVRKAKSRSCTLVRG